MLRERFEYLLTKKLSDELSAEEVEEWFSLLENNPDLHAEYQLLQQYWNRKESHSLRDEQLFQKIVSRIEEKPHTIGHSKKFVFQLVAAAVMLLLVSAAFWLYWPSRKQEQELSTVHLQRAFVLEDGTEVFLNAASSLKYPKTFDSLRREVSLIGEAFFKVASDQHRPFIVHTQHAKLKVLGTSFNLRAYPDEAKTETSLIEGALEVSLNKDAAQVVRLKPSEKLTIHTHTDTKEGFGAVQGGMIRSKISFFYPNDTTAIETSWLDNKLVFKDMPFDELAKELERKYGVEISFQSSRARTLRFSAAFKKESLDQILSALKLASNFNYQIISHKVLIDD